MRIDAKIFLTGRIFALRIVVPNQLNNETVGRRRSRAILGGAPVLVSLDHGQATRQLGKSCNFSCGPVGIPFQRGLAISIYGKSNIKMRRFLPNSLFS